MQPNQRHLRIAYAETFKDQRTVDAYQFRPPYPDEIFDLLVRLVTDEPRTALDVGCGAGDIARNLARRAIRVDAVDFSQNMIERGKQLPGGDYPGLNWIVGCVEEVSLHPPYALITAGSSFHWFDWNVVLPRLRSMLTPGGYLALVHRSVVSQPWRADLEQILAQFSTGEGHPHGWLDTLVASQLFQKKGEQKTAPVPFVQSIDDFIEGLHSRSRFSKALMDAQSAAELDRQVRDLLLPLYQDGMISMQVVGRVVWGIPGEGE